MAPKEPSPLRGEFAAQWTQSYIDFAPQWTQSNIDFAPQWTQANLVFAAQWTRSKLIFAALSLSLCDALSLFCGIENDALAFAPTF